ncbi:MAG: hypothetical protein A3J93_04450 [Candidatus Magasanikbacteria bacterium RIFOXYC2_FULL_42_28]|uniref:NAD-dependent epimerase/dehydratase domain-containing protein n=1 Tax=Candidatus Magasanikbacteria bacterium RIFOXYC2_FULL_42_28 TaxID=1798704 RepID=A0A1F6NX25_9BACT|nr:MAG: hypothetical protein A3J93_04450 [Candidatus Magasanikbacteria bacterium RIFOXYC2_FULL_42_28]
MSTKQIFSKKNVLVTGGAGFIGSHLCERLLKEANVICVDDFSNSHPDNIKHLLQYPDFEFVRHDINTPLDLEKLPELDKFQVKFQGVQEIYHLACPTSPKDFENLKMKSLHANSLAMLNTLDLAERHHAKYVYASSAVVYGDTTSESQLFNESHLGQVNQLSPRACYDEGKRFGETCVATYRQTQGIDAKIARVFTTYGPKMMLRQGLMIPDFILDAISGKNLVVYGDESFRTSLCYINDMIDGLVRLMSAPPDVWLINLGGDTNHRIIEVAQKIINLTGSSSTVAFEPALLFATKKGLPDLAYAKDVLDWMPLTRLEDGLQSTIDYTMANKEALLFDRKR